MTFDQINYIVNGLFARWWYYVIGDDDGDDHNYDLGQDYKDEQHDATNPKRDKPSNNETISKNWYSG